MKEDIHDIELGCGCGLVWGQFIDAGMDELVQYCPMCAEAVSKEDIV